MTVALREIADSTADPVASRLLAEYGAVFLTRATPPPVIVFQNAEEVERFQASLATIKRRFGDYEVILQSLAIEALTAAADELARQGSGLSARAADSGGRSFQETVQLWNRNVTRGLDHWVSLGRLESTSADAIRRLPPIEQVPVILELEQTRELFFSTFFDKSILYSVAAPGASQHLSLLAFDVAEFQDPQVESVLHRHGWFRTVTEDFPHFTYLGFEENKLTGLGLKRTVRDYQGNICQFWIPDL